MVVIRNACASRGAWYVRCEAPAHKQGLSAVKPVKAGVMCRC